MPGAVTVLAMLCEDRQNVARNVTLPSAASAALAEPVNEATTANMQPAMVKRNMI